MTNDVGRWPGRETGAPDGAPGPAPPESVNSPPPRRRRGPRRRGLRPTPAPRLCCPSVALPSQRRPTAPLVRVVTSEHYVPDACKSTRPAINSYKRVREPGGLSPVACRDDVAWPASWRWKYPSPLPETACQAVPDDHGRTRLGHRRCCGARGGPVPAARREHGVRDQEGVLGTPCLVLL